ncbi:murein biosynthesis integral membrane protein MurJ [Roseovarius sp. C7]|uniref:murein biosynthesis integral membrane protein MurJ n=1 Tax=Roseovarius sp. C7 TaxID=3398643 RepID=UPI0039F6D653
MMNFLHASMVVAGFMLLGRVTGFLREIVIAHVGGVSQQSDAMIVLLTFPDMMISLLLGGGLMAALVPRFRNLPAALGVALLLRVGTGLLIGFGALALVFAIWNESVLSIIAPGWDAHTVEAVAPMLRFTLIALPVTALSGVCVAFLNSQERFAYGAVGTLVFNLTLIAVLLSLDWLSPVEAIVVGIIGGAVVRFFVHISAIRPLWVRPDFSVADGSGALLRDFAASFGFYSILALMPPLLRAFASLVEPGALSIFNYAHKLMELPMAIIVAAVTTVLLPRLSGHVKTGEKGEAIDQLSNALRAVIVLLSGVFSLAFFSAELDRANRVFWSQL